VLGAEIEQRDGHDRAVWVEGARGRSGENRE
jgi:hypothetical protein